MKEKRLNELCINSKWNEFQKNIKFNAHKSFNVTHSESIQLKETVYRKGTNSHLHYFRAPSECEKTKVVRQQRNGGNLTREHDCGRGCAGSKQKDFDTLVTMS